MSPIERAVEIAKGQAALAKKLSCSRAFINQLVSGERPVPIELRPRIEAATGVRCEEFGDEITWIRDRRGAVTHFTTPVGAESPRKEAA